MDELDLLITSRLGERQKKIDRMAEMDKRLTARPQLRRYTISAVAACIVALLVLAPLAKQKPDFSGYTVEVISSDYRAASDEQFNALNALVKACDYQAALPLAENLLSQSDELLNDYNHLTGGWADTEEIEYEILLEQQINAQLRWTYILLLVQTEDYKEAEKELKRYLKHPDWCENEVQAQELKEALKEKNKNFFDSWVTFYADLLK